MSVVISGLGIVSALGVGVAENLAALRSSRDAIGAIRNFDTIHNVPAGELSLSNEELKRCLGLDERRTISRTSLLGMLAAKEAVQDAQITDTSNVAFISATTVGGIDLTPTFYKEFMNDENRGRLRFVAQHDCASSTEMIRNYCRLGGFSTAISTACSSSANAIIMGARMIQQGLAQTVVAGGTDALCAYTLNGFKSLMILDSAKCRPFDATRAGLNLGEAAAYVVLQKEETAKQIHCRLAGYANANDAHHQTAMTDEGCGAEQAMRLAMQKADIQPDKIDYINAHGTGTPNNDASEAHAMNAIWHEKLPPFSSTKAFTGHTLAAAGSVEAVFSALAIENNLIWPNLNFSRPMDEIPLVPTTQLLEKEVNTVLSNSFGFGGNCTSLIFSAR